MDGPATTYAGFGADERTGYEIGSITKIFTASLLADAIQRGEVTADTKVGALLPLGGAPYTGDPRIAWLLAENRLNVLIFGAAALVLLAATDGRLGHATDADRHLRVSRHTTANDAITTSTPREPASPQIAETERTSRA